MKNLALILLISIAQVGFGRTVYLSPSGNNNNNGSIAAPWLTLEYASSQLAAGDTLYLRGGTYRSTKALSVVNRFYLQNMNGTASARICILNYPGERPVFNMDDQLIPGTAGDGPVGLKAENCQYLHIRGIRITGMNQNPANINTPAGMILFNVDNSIVEQVEIDNIQGYGMYFQGGSDNNLIKNCDVHNIGDLYSGWGGANGFNITGGDASTLNTFDGCRAWWCSDDGFDFYGVNTLVTLTNCWSFWNGYVPGTFTHAGDGDGFKLGPMMTDQSGSSTVFKKLNRCLAFGNYLQGFDQNAQSNTTGLIEMYNCTAAYNRNNGFFMGANTSVNQRFKNNLNYGNGLWGDEIITGPNISNNSWNGFTVSNNDFLSIDTTGHTAARQADGSLPYTPFMKLKAGSSLIDAGTTAVGLSYNGTAPDLGAFEYSSGAPNQAPNANAGPDKTIHVPSNSTSVSGSGTDPDGSISAYQWTKVGGPAAAVISTPAAAATTLTSLVAGTYQFELKVTDNLGATGRDTMLVIVNNPPVVNAGADQSLTLPVSTVTLTGTASDPDGSIASTQWSKISGPASFAIASPATLQTLITTLVQGSYKFELRATDNLGAITRDTLTITVNIAANQAPVANAGADRSITLPVNSLSVTGTGNDPDGNITAYQWTKISGPATFSIATPTQATTNINNLLQGVYEFELRVTDNLGATGRDTMKVTVNAAPNQSPIANAGIDRTITLPASSLTVNGSGTDPDGSISAYQWTKLSGPAGAVIASSTQAQTLISGLVQGNYQFELRVTDNLGATGRDTMNITVNAAPNQLPVANAGTNQTITLPANTVTLNGSGTDPDGSISAYAWTNVSGPTGYVIVSPSQAQTVVNNLVQGTYVFRLTVTDNSGATADAFVTVTVNSLSNQSPSANAGTDQSITLPVSSISLTGSGTDPDGNIAAYQWAKISGPASSVIANASQAQTIVSNLVQGVYVFSLTVTDNAGATGIDYITITVNAAANQAPVVTAGNDQTLTLPVNTVTLTGTASDPDGSIVSYSWSKISGPATFSINSATQVQTIVNNLVQGVYVFRLSVTDNNGATADAFVTITVNAAPNQLPLASAGNDQTITLPLNTVTLSGNGTDPDGSVASFAWSRISGPAQFTIVSPSQPQTVVNNLAQGVYVFRLRVTDNNGASADAFVTITVNNSNQSPVANAGPDQALTLPANSLTLSGSGYDPDGSISSYSWTKISGPAQFVVISPAQASTVVNNLMQGTYQFVLTVTDNNGATGRDTVTVTVNAAIPANQAPVVNAGNNQSITLPVNSVNLLGSATDADGSIAAYQWAKIAGPAQFTIVFPTQAQTTVNNLLEGVYQFELRALDNQGAVGRDTVTITVSAQPNQAPVVSAGPDRSMTYPANAITQTGSATDADGSVVTYRWTKISGPAQYTIETPDQLKTVFSNLEEGVYEFELLVTDNHGATGRDTTTVTVKSSGNLLKQAYPNPATTEINVKIDATNSASTSLVLAVYDAQGLSLYRKQLPLTQLVVTERIETSKLPAGWYIIEVTADGSKRSTMKFVKQ